MRRASTIRLQLELLESRDCPAGTLPGLTADQIRAAYGVPSSPTLGRGVEVDIPDVGAAPWLDAALAQFSAANGLPQMRPGQLIHQVDPLTNTHAALATGGWQYEIALDVEMVHAIAPGATIRLIECDSALVTDLYGATAWVARYHPRAIVSQSYGVPDPFAPDDGVFGNGSDSPTNLFIAASGDSGAGQVSDPAEGALELAVGATDLRTDANGKRLGESLATLTGSGFALLLAYRYTPDVTGPGGQSAALQVWLQETPGAPITTRHVYGTSESAPFWAGIAADVEQVSGWDLNASTLRGFLREHPRDLSRVHGVPYGSPLVQQLLNDARQDARHHRRPRAITPSSDVPRQHAPPSPGQIVVPVPGRADEAIAI